MVPKQAETDSIDPTEHRRTDWRVGPWVRVAMMVIVWIGVSACQQAPPVAQMGEAAEAGEMRFTVAGYSVVQPEITTDEGVYEYAKPVLAVTMRVENVGKDAFRYVPAHGGRQMTEASSPLLYYAPEDSKAPLPPKKKSPLKGVVLEEGTLKGQVNRGKRLAPGDSLTDRYLFELPSEKEAELVFSVPPTMHRGERPVLHRISYSYSEPEGPPIRKVGETVSLDGIAFSVDAASLEYVELKGSGGKDGYSTNPLLKISYTIDNTTDSPVTYRPGHRTTSGPRPPALYPESDQTRTVPRVKFSSDLSPVDQVQGTTSIEAGGSVNDFALFEKPSGDISSLQFEYPAARIGRKGLIRYAIPFSDREAPDPPEKLKEQLDKSNGEGADSDEG